MSLNVDRNVRLGCIWFTIIGALAGWLAGKALEGHGFGFWKNLLIGIVGAYVGGFLFALLGLQTKSKIGALVMATVGAIVLLLALNAINRR